MTNGAEPAERNGQEDVTDYALDGWGRTIRLCAIRLSAAIPPALSIVVIWLCSRH